MADPRAYVSPGQPIKIAAAQINHLNRLMRADTSMMGGPIDGLRGPYTWVYAKNTTGATVDRWGVMKIDGVEVTPTSDDTAKATYQFLSMPVLTGVSATSSSATATETCVAIEPIKNNKIGRVAVDGVVQVKADDSHKLAGAMTLWKNADWALVRLCGGVLFGTISATWNKGSTATVTQIKADGSAITSAPTFTAKNWFANVTVATGTKRVACAKVGDTWILIAAEC